MDTQPRRGLIRLLNEMEDPRCNQRKLHRLTAMTDGSTVCWPLNVTTTRKYYLTVRPEDFNKARDFINQLINPRQLDRNPTDTNPYPPVQKAKDNNR